MEPKSAVAGSKNLKYMPITDEIKAVASSRSTGPTNRNVQSKHVPKPICRRQGIERTDIRGGLNMQTDKHNTRK